MVFLRSNIRAASHGVRTVENLRIHCGITDPDELEVGRFSSPLPKHSLNRFHVAQREAVRFEEAIVSSASQDGRKGIVALPGVRQIIDEVGE